MYLYSKLLTFMATPLNDKQKLLQATIDAYDAIKGSLSTITKEQERLKALQESYAEKQRLINELTQNFNDLTDDQKDRLNSLIGERAAELTEIRKLVASQEELNKKVQKQQQLQQLVNQRAKELWGWLNENDKIIRQTTLNLGLSGTKAQLLRDTFYDVSQSVFAMGGTLGDVQTIMQGFADETGRARVLTEGMLESIVAIGRGTGLGVEQATKLAAQFEYMGFDAKSTMNYVQGVVDTSERMGINTTKVLRNVSDNFKKLSSFTFNRGVKAMADMSISAEKTRVSMQSALNIAEASRGLEKVIELGANLQVMGGEFAKFDPLSWLYTVRNEPDKINEKISEMTRGLYTLRKTADGTFEAFISPVDADRMRFVAQQLGISNEEIAEIGQRRLALDKIGGSLKGLGFSKEQQEWVAGAAMVNKATGEYQVRVGENLVNVKNLTKQQADAFVQEQKTLRDRANEALTFDEALKATINEFKSTLLPMLDGVNAFLRNVKPVADDIAKWLKGATFSDIGKKILYGIGMLSATIATFSVISSSLVGTLTRFAISKIGAGITRLAPSLATTGGGAGGGATGGAMGGLGKGAGVGLAAVGIGAGIGIAATGISKLADGMAKLDKTQIWALPATIAALALSFLAFTPAIAAAGGAAGIGSLGLLAIGAAAVGIGFGINLAAKGIGKMSEGLAILVDKSKGAGWELSQVALGIAAINLAMATTGTVGAIGAFLGGFKTLDKTLTIIESHAEGIDKVGNAFKNISTVLSGNKEDFVVIQNAVEAISKMNTKGGGMLNELATLLKSPLKVEFADGKIGMVNDITLNIDGQKFMQKTYDVNLAVQKHEAAKHGKGSSR